MKNILIFTLIFAAFGLHLNAQIFSLRDNDFFNAINNDSRSANWVDLNGDLHLDIFITNGKNPGQNNVAYINDGAGGFTALTNSPLLTDNRASDGATFADVLNNGTLACFIANWHNQPNLYYYDDLVHGLVQVTGNPPADLNSYSETGSWGDFDNDGFVDLYVSNSFSVLENYLYKNNGDETFTLMNINSVSTDQFSSRSVNWIDYDMDGDQDLFVSNENNEVNNLYRNNSNGTFTTIQNSPLTNSANSSMSSAWADYDNDGDFDVFISNYGQNNELYRNDGGLFTLISDTVCNDGGLSFGASWGDIDNDGDLDLYVGNAYSTGVKLQQFLYINNGNGSFSRNSTDTLSKVTAWNYGNAFGDFDKDGDLDLLTANCHNGAEKNRLFINETDQNSGNNNWIEIRCEGTSSNRSAIGAKVRVKANIDGQNVWQIREISAQSSYCGQNMLTTHFGLFDANVVDSVEIIWPSGIRDTASLLDAGHEYYALEGQGILIIPESISKPGIKNGLELYPNPSNGKLNIKNPFNKGVEIEIRNSVGNLVKRFDYEDQEIIEINLSHSKLKSGLYYVTCSSEGEVYFNKFLLNK